MEKGCELCLRALCVSAVFTKTWFCLGLLASFTSQKDGLFPVTLIKLYLFSQIQQ